MTADKDDVREDLLIGTWNLWEHGMFPGRAGEQDRYRLQAQIMREELPCHVWLVQEVANVEAFTRLADEVGMTCMVGAPGKITEEPVFDPGGAGFGVGVMWDPHAGISAVPGTRRIYTRDVFFHGLAAVVLQVADDMVIQAAAGHATPWGPPQSFIEAKRWASVMTRPNRGIPGKLGQVALPGVLGTDSNGLTGDQIQQPDGSWRHHADDPLEGQDWFPDMIYQLAYPRELDPATGKPVPKSDRTPGDLLWDAGLHDPSAVLGLEFTPTTGYHDVDPFPDRDLDHTRVTQDIVDAGAIIDVRVLNNKRVRTVSDHRPKRLRLKRSRLPRTPFESPPARVARPPEHAASRP